MREINFVSWYSIVARVKRGFLAKKYKKGLDTMNEERKNICGVKEVATYLNISESGVYKLVREKRIPYFKVLSCLRFDLNEINSWVEKSQEQESKFSILLGI